VILRGVILSVVLGSGVFSALPVAAEDSKQNSDKAVAAAKTILGLVSANKLNTLWEKHVSAWYKTKVAQSVFFENLSFGRSQVGGAPLSAAVQNMTYSTGEQGITGDVYAVTFETKYATGKFYERIVVFKEPDGEFRLVGLFGTPAPRD